MRKLAITLSTLALLAGPAIAGDNYKDDTFNPAAVTNSNANAKQDFAASIAPVSTAGKKFNFGGGNIDLEHQRRSQR